MAAQLLNPAYLIILSILVDVTKMNTIILIHTPVTAYIYSIYI